jgi:hypothetical protein
MDDHNMLEYLLGQYKERMSMLSDAMSRGMCTSFEEYKFTCGQLRGLEAAGAVIKDLQERMETMDE